MPNMWDEKQFETVMHTFKNGKLRSSTGETVKTRKQAQAIAASEAELAEKHGKEKRTWRGRTRMRPKKA